MRYNMVETSKEKRKQNRRIKRMIFFDTLIAYIPYILTILLSLTAIVCSVLSIILYS